VWPAAKKKIPVKRRDNCYPRLSPFFYSAANKLEKATGHKHKDRRDERGVGDGVGRRQRHSNVEIFFVYEEE
jgi:hypothetical protein